MKFYPVISKPIYRNNIQVKHDTKKSAVKEPVKPTVMPENIRSYTGSYNKELSVGSLTEIRKVYERLLVIEFMLMFLNLIIDLFYPQEYIPKHKEKRAPQKNKRVLEYYIQNARNRKKVINDGKLYEFEQETKQQNLDKLVSELESEQIVKPVAQPDMAWIDSLNKAKTASERENKLRADKFFKQLADKQCADERCLERKSLATQPVQNTDIDYDDLYEKTKSTRAVVNAFNYLQRTK
jgi:hypothetical protein